MERNVGSALIVGVMAVAIAATLTADVNRDAAGMSRGLEVRAELRAISSKVDGSRSQVLIEASEPVAYVTSQPDPLTVLVDLRNVTAGMMPPGVLGPQAPIADVRVEEAVAGDGATIARVRVKLAYAAKHRVRSSRNIIYVEVDRPVIVHETPAAAAITRATAPAAPASTRAATVTAATNIKSVRALANGRGIALVGNGRLIAATIEEAKDQPARLLIDFHGVSALGVPAVTEVNRGDVERIRVGTNSVTPLITRVVIDLTRKSAYRVEERDSELQVLFGDAATPAGVIDRLGGIGGAGGIGAAGAGAQAAAAPVAPRPPFTPVGVAPAAPAAPVPPGPPAAPPGPTALPPTTAPPMTLVAASQQPPAPPAASEPPPATPARFQGHAVTLDFQGADLRSVLRTFADISGLNMVIDPSINGTVDVSLKDVPWDQALDIILKANKLGYSVDGTVVRIAPIQVLAQEEEERRKLNEAQALAGELRVMTIPLSYAKADLLVPILTSSALSARGEVQVDTRTNTLILRDLPDRLTTATELVKALDRPQPQVEIEARIVQTTRDFARAIGVQWGLNGRVDPALGNTTGLAFPNNGSIRGGLGGAQGPAPVETGINLPAAAATSAIGIALGAVNGAFNLDVALSALESSGRGRLLSTPRVSTQNNVEAEVTQGVQIPIQTVANNTVTVSFKDAALTLRVTPQITASNTVIMRVFLENATPDFSRAVNGIPPIDTQRAVTTVLVADGETTVIGGIYVSIEQASNDRVPLLHRVPLLGWLFKRDELSDESRELLIFITPRITKS